MCDSCKLEMAEKEEARLAGLRLLTNDQKLALRMRIKEHLHNTRHQMRLNGLDTFKQSFVQTMRQYALAEGTMKGVEILGYGSWSYDTEVLDLRTLFNELKNEVLDEENYQGDHFCDICYEKHEIDDVRKFKLTTDDNNLADDYKDIIRDTLEKDALGPMNFIIAATKRSNWNRGSDVNFVRADYKEFMVSVADLNDKYKLAHHYDKIEIIEGGNIIAFSKEVYAEDGSATYDVIEVVAKELLYDFNDEFKAYIDEQEQKRKQPNLTGLSKLLDSKGVELTRA